MAKLVRLNSEEEAVLFAVRTSEDRLEAAGLVSEALEKVDTSLDAIFSTARKMADSFARMGRPQDTKSAEVSFGLKITAKGTVYVVESSGEASVNVKFTF